ncbi:MAG: hypothetical protein JO235_03155 [Chroococcidiopsidaceae cyanobacterium CP_BM_RX_35]|nr:hypothetical protein [Chroococcidiopsidaceae cyanobacterium CP_BM_RX_35]
MNNNSGSRLDQIEAILTQTAQQQHINTIAIAELRAAVNQHATDADADRTLMTGMMEMLVELRQENRQILDYLFNQQRGNGRG